MSARSGGAVRGAVNVRSVEFAGVIAKPGGVAPARLPQIAFAGRSNVGKSSLINRLLGRTRTPVAHVSATPGKTQLIHFYRVRADLGRGGETQFLLADLPGYGYARVPLAVRDAWRPLIESYLAGSTDLKGVVQLVDIRHDLRADDRRMVAYLASLGVPTLFVLTKADKLSATRRRARERELTAALGADADQVIAVSARTGEGCAALASSLDDLLVGDGA